MTVRLSMLCFEFSFDIFVSIYDKSFSFKNIKKKYIYLVNKLSYKYFWKSMPYLSIKNVSLHFSYYTLRACMRLNHIWCNYIQNDIKLLQSCHILTIYIWGKNWSWIQRFLSKLEEYNKIFIKQQRRTKVITPSLKMKKKKRGLRSPQRLSLFKKSNPLIIIFPHK